VASFVTNPPCLRDSFFQRVDTQLEWLDEQIRKYDPGGMGPAPDGGASDAAPASPADAGAGKPADAQGADAVPPKPAPAPDARPRDLGRAPAEPEPTPEEPTPASGSEGGCNHAGGAGGGPGGLLLLALACLARRWRRPRPLTGPRPAAPSA
jgi:hypothetical protein